MRFRGFSVCTDQPGRAQTSLSGRGKCVSLRLSLSAPSWATTRASVSLLRICARAPLKQRVHQRAALHKNIIIIIIIR